jgi:hypothetical protein
MVQGVRECNRVRTLVAAVRVMLASCNPMRRFDRFVRVEGEADDLSGQMSFPVGLPETTHHDYKPINEQAPRQCPPHPVRPLLRVVEQLEVEDGGQNERDGRRAGAAHEAEHHLKRLDRERDDEGRGEDAAREEGILQDGRVGLILVGELVRRVLGRLVLLGRADLEDLVQGCPAWVQLQRVGEKDKAARTQPTTFSEASSHAHDDPKAADSNQPGVVVRLEDVAADRVAKGQVRQEADDLVDETGRADGDSDHLVHPLWAVLLIMSSGTKRA